MKILNATLHIVCVVHNAVYHILDTALANVMCVCVCVCVGDKVYLMIELIIK
jgi:hypothetical protein